MTAPQRTAAFFKLADRGVASAHALLKAEQFEDTALYIQQIVERVARALLTHAGIPFGTSHNLAQMSAALPKDHVFSERIRQFDEFSTAVTAYRYPNPSGHLKGPPQITHLKESLARAEQLLKDAKELVYGP